MRSGPSRRVSFYRINRPPQPHQQPQRRDLGDQLFSEGRWLGHRVGLTELTACGSLWITIFTNRHISLWVAVRVICGETLGRSRFQEIVISRDEHQRRQAVSDQGAVEG
jgi:hypothetical protein